MSSDLLRLQQYFNTGGYSGMPAESPARPLTFSQPPVTPPPTSSPHPLNALTDMFGGPPKVQQQQQQQPPSAASLASNTTSSSSSRVRLTQHEENTKRSAAQIAAQFDTFRHECSLRMAKTPEMLAEYERDAKEVILSTQDGLMQYTVASLIGECQLGINHKEIQGLLALRAPSIQTEPFGSLVAKLNALVEDDALNSQRVRVALHESDARVKQLQMAIDQNDVWRDQAINAEENIPAGEEHYKRLLGMLEELMMIVHQRIGIASGQGNQSVVTKSFEETFVKTNEELLKHRQANDALRQRLAKDFRAVEEKRSIISKENDLRTLEFTKKRETDALAVDANAKRQVDAWNRIVKIFEELSLLSNERSALVAQMVDARDAEERRKLQHTRMIETMGIHVQNMNTIARELEQFDKLYAEVGSCAEGARGKLIAKTREVEAVLREVRLDEQKNHLSVYRRYMLTIGDYVYRRERRLGDITRARKMAELSREVARDVLDKNIDKYTLEMNQLEREGLEISNEVKVLRGRMEHATKEFVPTEIALREAKLQFLHPQKELQDYLSQRELQASAIRKKYDQA
eukprot:PhF_6_TR35394/c0_g1_i3/m.51473